MSLVSYRCPWTSEIGAVNANVYECSTRFRVTLGFLLGGAITGAVIGAGLLAVLGLVVDGPGGFPPVWDAYEVAAIVGAIIGGLALPLVAWSLLRHVPLWHVFAETSVGTIIGGSVGLLASGLNATIAVMSAFGGFVLAAGIMRFRNRPPKLTPG